MLKYWFQCDDILTLERQNCLDFETQAFIIFSSLFHFAGCSFNTSLFSFHFHKIKSSFSYFQSELLFDIELAVLQWSRFVLSAWWGPVLGKWLMKNSEAKNRVMRDFGYLRRACPCPWWTLLPHAACCLLPPMSWIINAKYMFIWRRRTTCRLRKLNVAR